MRKLRERTTVKLAVRQKPTVRSSQCLVAALTKEKREGWEAPFAAADAVGAAHRSAFDEGLKNREREGFLKLVFHAYQSKAQRSLSPNARRPRSRCSRKAETAPWRARRISRRHPWAAGLAIGAGSPNAGIPVTLIETGERSSSSGGWE